MTGLTPSRSYTVLHCPSHHTWPIGADVRSLRRTRGMTGVLDDKGHRCVDRPRERIEASNPDTVVDRSVGIGSELDPAVLPLATIDILEDFGHTDPQRHGSPASRRCLGNFKHARFEQIEVGLVGGYRSEAWQ